MKMMIVVYRRAISSSAAVFAPVVNLIGPLKAVAHGAKLKDDRVRRDSCSSNRGPALQHELVDVRRAVLCGQLQSITANNLQRA
jgi:hypothetical protein